MAQVFKNPVELAEELNNKTRTPNWKTRDAARQYFYNKYYSSRSKPEVYQNVAVPNFTDQDVIDEANEFIRQYERPVGRVSYVKKNGKWVESDRGVDRYLDTGLFNEPKNNDWYKFDRSVGAFTRVNPYYQTYESISPTKDKKVLYEGLGVAGREEAYKDALEKYYAEMLSEYLK